jgi:hypothetical protein
MKLEFHIKEDKYMRIIKTSEGEIDFESNWEIYCPIYGDQIFIDFENQMGDIWDIIEVEKVNL